MQYLPIIDRLEGEIRQLRVEYQRFFNGEISIPPEDEGERIRRRLSELASVAQLSPVERFRLNGLESRFNSMSELHRRRMRDLSSSQRAAVLRAGTAGGAARSTAGVVVGPESSAEQIGNLYERVYPGQKTTVALEDFHKALEKQAAKVRDKTGCKNVRFTVRTEAGKRRLRARPAD